VTTLLTSERDRTVLLSFAHRIDANDAGAHNNLGVLYFNKGMIEDAVAEFSRALELDPRMTIAQRNLEIAYFTSGYYDRRVEELTERLRTHPGDREARWELGRTWYLLGDMPRAIEEFGQLLAEEPDDVRVIWQVAVAEGRRGDLEAAARWLEHALSVEPDNPSLLFQLGEVAYHRGLNEEARRALTRAVELAPDDADALYLLGFVLGDQGDHAAAQESARRALRINPSLGRAHANLSLERFDAHSYARAREQREARGLGDGMSVVEEGQLAHYGLGLAFRHKGYLDEALREYTVALERGEDRQLVQQAMAEVHLLRRDPQAAIALYDQLLETQPDSPKLWNERGVALHQSGRGREALEAYQRAVAADGSYAIALNNLGVASFHEGQREAAFDAFRRALQEQPGFLKARLNLALLLVRQSEHSHALEGYRQVLRLAPEHPVAWNGVGLVLSHLKRFEDARNAFARAIEARPTYAQARYNLSFALSNLGDFAGALRETKHALELDPFYTPQKFDLAIDVESEDPTIEIGPDQGEARPAEAIPEFVLDPGALDSLFSEFAPAPPAPAAMPLDEEPYRPAAELLARGALAEAHHAIRVALAAGAPRAAGLVAHGDVFMAQGATGEALERYREARLLDPAYGPGAAGELRALVTLRRYEEAAATAEWMASFAPDDASALLLIAEVRMETGRIEAAREALQAARKAAPMRADVLASSGRLARAAGDDAEAIRAWRDALALDHAADCRLELALLLEATGALDEAEAELVATITARPSGADAVLALARMRREQRRADETIGPLATFLGLEPYHLEALASLGESLFLVGRRDDAAFAFARIRKFDRDHVAALYFEGVLLAEQHAFEAAIERWRRVSELQPASDFAHRARRDTRSAEDLQRIFLRPARGAA
jgi:tetratricopeptide (TPR) repeat protein